MLVALALIALLMALGATELRVYRCPRHSDVFDAMVCPLCSIRMFRQQEIDAFTSDFEQGRNGGMFTDC